MLAERDWVTRQNSNIKKNNMNKSESKEEPLLLFEL
jgi:hypothetical protein